MLGRGLIILGVLMIAFVLWQKQCALSSDSTVSPPMFQSELNTTPSDLQDTPTSDSFINEASRAVLEDSAELQNLALESQVKEQADLASEEPLRTERIVVDFDQLKDRGQSQAESQFGKSYKLVAEGLQVSEYPTLYEVDFLRGIKDVISVVIVGQDGEVNLQAFKVNDQDLPNLIQPRTLFAQDWFKTEESFAHLQSLELKTQAHQAGSFNIYVQVMGDQ